MKRLPQILRIIETERIYLLLALAIVAVVILEPGFANPLSVRGVLNQAAPSLIVATGLTLVLICGQIDLSIGSTLALAGMVAISLQPELGVWPAALAGIGAGVLVGLVNGVLVAYARIASILATLASMIAVQGIALTIADRNTVSGIDIGTSLWIQSSIATVLSPTILAALAVVISAQIVLSQTAVGRTIYLIGGSDNGGRLSGIRTERYLVAAFAACGGLAAGAGVLLSLGLNTGSAYFGESTVFTVIAAVVIGGTSLLGAEGSALRSALGVLFMAIIGFGFAMGGIPTFILQVVTGTILLGIVLLDSYLGLRRRRAWRLRRIAVQHEATAEGTTA